jgi:hypothetical protein
MHKIMKGLILCLTVLLLLAAIPAAEANHASLTTDKSCYNFGSAATIKLANVGQQAITLTSNNPWDIKDTNNNLVFSPMKNNQLEDLDAGDSKSWLWNQKNQNNVQVAAGSYKAAIATNSFDPDDGVNLEAAFSVAADADEDCTIDSADICPYDATNTCRVNAGGGGDDGSGIQLWPPPEHVMEVWRDIKSHQYCVGNTRLCVQPGTDPDGDGATEEQGDKCPGQSGPAWNEYCPDYDYKKTEAERVRSVASKVATDETGWTWVIPFYGLAKAMHEVITVNQESDNAAGRIAHDPPDPNYKEIAKLEYPRYMPLAGTDEQSYLVNAHLVAAINYAAAAEAFVKSNERFMGAELASDHEWMQSQALMTRFYAYKTAEALKQLNNVLTEHELSLAKTGEGGLVFTKAQLQQFQDKLRSEGINALPQAEIDFARNNLFMSEEKIARLPDHILEQNPAAWVEKPLVAKMEDYKDANNRFIIALENYAAKVGANIQLVRLSDGDYELRASNIPNGFKAGFILLRLESTSPMAESFSVLPGDLPVDVAGMPMGESWQNVFFYSRNGALPAGTSGVLAKIVMPKSDPHARPVIMWLAGFPDWIVAARQPTIAEPTKTEFVYVAQPNMQPPPATRPA